MRWILAFVLFLVSPVAALAQQAAPAARIYTVFFEVGTDPAGKVDTMKVVAVVDPVTRQPDAAMGETLPPAYIAATRELLRTQTYSPGEHFYTSNSFDPQRPNEARIVPPDPD
jgi:hypothetical protein